MKKRRNHDAGFNARMALETLNGEHTVSELSADCGMHLTMIRQSTKHCWTVSQISSNEAARKFFEIAEETVRDLHAYIGKLVVANDFLPRMLKPRPE